MIVVDLGEEVQYEIDEMTITADEKHVVYSNIYSNDIVFLDFKAKKKTKIIKGKLHILYKKVSIDERKEITTLLMHNIRLDCKQVALGNC